MAKFYVVWQGKAPGVYNNWDDCKRQIDGFLQAKYKSFPNQQEAEAAFKQSPYKFIGAQAAANKQPVNRFSKPIVPSISVDAACSGNPGIMEYRGVDTQTKEIIFASPRFPDATNNIGEFLALVQAMAYAHKHGITVPIYSDSITAMSWVKKKEVKTNLQHTPNNPQVFNLIERALVFLKTNKVKNSILKWETVIWGEIPADYDRK